MGVSAEGTGLFFSMGAHRGLMFHTLACEPIGSVRSRQSSAALLNAFRGFLRTESSRAQSIGESEAYAEDTWRPERDVVVLQILVPEGGLELPSGTIRIQLEDDAGRRSVQAEVVEALSTAPGLHKEGTLILVALRIRSLSAWPDEATGTIRWKSRYEGKGRRERTVFFNVPRWNP